MKIETKKVKIHQENKVMHIVIHVCIVISILFVVISMLFTALYPFGLSETMGVYSYIFFVGTFILCMFETLLERYNTRRK